MHALDLCSPRGDSHAALACEFLTLCESGLGEELEAARLCGSTLHDEELVESVRHILDRDVELRFAFKHRVDCIQHVLPLVP
jgi:hypothetical protein